MDLKVFHAAERKSSKGKSKSDDTKDKTFKRKKKRKKHSSTSSDSTSEEEKRRLKKERKKLKKIKKREKKAKIADNVTSSKAASIVKEDVFDVPIHLMDTSKSMAPMTREEWEKGQNIIRKVYDESSGRDRLVKGDGEVLEEIVSKDRHKAINVQATRGDGNFFQAQLTSELKK